MYSVDEINNAIEALLEQFRDGEDYVPYRTVSFENDAIGEDDRIEVDLNIDEEVSNLLDAFNIKNSVELVEAFENPGVTCYVLCIAYWAEDDVQSYNVPVYLC